MAGLKEFMDNLVQGIVDLKTLEVRTVVGACTWNKDTKKIEYNYDDVKMILTQVDLLGGDITTAFSVDFLAEPYAKIREFHAEREKRAQEIIDGNIKALKELVEFVVTLDVKRKQVKE